MNKLFNVFDLTAFYQKPYHVDLGALEDLFKAVTILHLKPFVKKISIVGDGKPLGDRELMLKKKRMSTSDLSPSEDSKDLEDDLGNGIFDRFSSARKTLTRGSLR